MNTTASRGESSAERFLQRLAPIEPAETAAVIAAFFLFFFFWAGYFAVRPVRETIATMLGGNKAVANLWLYTSALSILIVPFFGLIVARVPRSVFLPVTYAIVAVVLAFVGLNLRGETINLVVGKSFYVFISVLNLFLLSVFWSFLLEIFDGGQAKRLFGFIAAGGTAGALAGPLIADLSVKSIGNSGVMFVGGGLFIAAIVPQQVLVFIWKTSRSQMTTSGANERPIGGNVFAGVGAVLRSPYLLGIALFVVLLSTVSTILYFEQLRLVELMFSSITERTRVFARLDWIVQSLTILSQVFLTGRIAARFGVGTLLMIVPVLMVFGFVGLALSGTFTVLAMVFVGRRALEYAFARPGREMLWSPLDNEARYKAKNTIDVPVYRGADALSAQVNNGIIASGFSSAAVAVMGAGVAAAWAVVGWWLGRKFKDQVAAVDTDRDVGA
jgi:ATP:ADP antiporter, AAA family